MSGKILPCKCYGLEYGKSSLACLYFTGLLNYICFCAIQFMIQVNKLTFGLSRCIHAVMTRSVVWAATATALNRLPLAVSPAAGGRSDATEMLCAALGTAAVTVRLCTHNFIAFFFGVDGDTFLSDRSKSLFV